MKEPVVAAWGGGVNSTAMLIEWIKRQERLDLVLFADTGGEKPETYAYRDTFARWLKAHTTAPFITVTGTYKYPTLEAECLGSKTLPSVAYGYKRCSLKWKRQPQDKFCNHYEPLREAWNQRLKVVKLIGYDSGEPQRAAGAVQEDEKYRYRYPLIEWDMGRDQCVDSIRAADLPVPPKSSCFFCPHSKVHEIIKLREEHPELVERALEIERNADLTATVGLGRHFSWQAVVNQDSKQSRFAFAVPDMPCGCYDGDDEEDDS